MKGMCQNSIFVVCMDICLYLSGAQATDIKAVMSGQIQAYIHIT